MSSRRSSNKYRQEAARCRDLAAVAKEPIARAGYVKAAESYDRLAGQVANPGKLGRRAPPPKTN